MPRHYWVAFSGGLDSHVLLHFLATQFPEFSIEAIHINHQLLPEATLFEKTCSEICKALAIRLHIQKITLQKQRGQSLEALARAARYRALKTFIKPQDILFTAHHQTDQAETVLLQLLRGAGLRGVSAMPAISCFGDGFLVRPLLNFSRDDLTSYATHYGLQWIDDPSNQDQQFDRNYLRQTVFPLLKKRFPHVDQTLTRFAKHCITQEQLIATYADIDIQACQTTHPDALSIQQLKTFDTIRQQSVLRHWLRSKNLPLPSQAILHAVQKNLLQARPDANPIVRWAGVECRRYQDQLFAFAPLAARDSTLTDAEMHWCKKNLPVALTVPDIHIQFRQGGERFRPAGCQQSRSLKHLFQQWRVPTWERNRVPLIYYHQQLIAVVGHAIAQIND